MITIAWFTNIGSLQAQNYSYSAEVEAMESDASPKLLFTAIIDLVPNADLVYNDALNMLTIHTTTALVQAELEQATISGGYYLISFTEN